MSQALRELVVSIDFGDIDTSRLLAMDNAVDNVGNGVKDLGGGLDQLGVKADEAGTGGAKALDQISVGAGEAGAAMVALDGAIVAAGAGMDDFTKNKMANLEATLDNINGKIEMQEGVLAGLRESLDNTFNPAGRDKLQEKILNAESTLLRLQRQSDKTAKELWELDDSFNAGSKSATKMGSNGDKALKEVGQGAKNADNALSTMGKTGGKATGQVKKGATGAEKELNKMGQAAKKSGHDGANGNKKMLGVLDQILPKSKASGMASVLFSNPWTAAAAAVVAALVGVGVAIVGIAKKSDEAFDRMQAMAGMSDETRKRMEGVALSVYKKGFGEGLDEIAKDVAIVSQAFKNMDDAGLDAITSGAYLIKDLWGADVKETVKTIKTMTANFKDLSEQDALDLIVAGFQKGGDYAGDFLSTLNDDAVTFSKLGVSAEDFIGILLKGGDAGALNLAKIGDAFKEISIRASEGSEQSKDAFEALGFNAATMGKKFAEGGDEAKEALDATIAALSFVDDAQIQTQIGMDLFGNNWKVLRENVIFAMDGAGEAVAGFEGATNKATDIMDDNIGTKWTWIVRGFKSAIIEAFGGSNDAVGGLLDGVLGVMPKVIDGIKGAVDWIKGIFNDNESEIGRYIDGISGYFTGFWSLLQGIFNVIGPFLSATLGGALGVVFSIAGTVLGAIGDIFSIFGKLLNGDWGGAWESVKDLFNGIINGILGTAKSLLSLLFGIFNSTIGRVFTLITGIDLTQAGKDMINGLLNGVMAMKDMAIEKVKDVAKGMWSGFKSFFGIESPSRLMMEGGVNVVQGLEIGIDKTAQDAMSAAQAMSAGVANAVTDAPEISAIMNGTGDGGSGPTPTTDKPAPADDGGQPAPGGVVVTVPVTVNVPEGTSRDDAESVGKIVQEKVDETLRAIFTQLGIVFQ